MTQERHAELGIHSMAGDTDPEALLKRRQIARRTRIAAVVVLILLALGATRTVLSRIANAKTLEATAATNAVQYVKVTSPKAGGAAQTLALPGSLQGQAQSPIGARASGYLKRWTKDIGARVEKGELLAEIETPEIDQQLVQAVAAREQAAAALALARSTVQRWEGLRQKDVVSQQDLDERRGAAAQAQANLAAAEANVQRLRQLEGFKRITAPFAGVITRRNVEVGDLIDAGGGGGSGSRALFVLSQTDPLRVYVNVPQAYAHLVKVGQPVTVSQAELRGQSFKGEIARTAGALDAATRMMQVEVALAPTNGALMPGAYVQVSLPLAASRSLVIPTNTLLFRAEGTRVAVVDGQGKVTLRKVALGRNFGENVEVTSGIAAADRVVLNPPDSMADGDVVVVVATPPAAAAASGAASGAASSAAAPAGRDAVAKDRL